MLFDGHEIPRAWRVGDFELEVGSSRVAGWTARPGCFAGSPARPGCTCRAPSRPSTRASTSIPRHEPSHTAWRSSPRSPSSDGDQPRRRTATTPGVALGDTVPLPFAVARADLQEIVSLGRGVRDWLDSDPRAGGYAVEFSELTVSLADARVIDGSVNTQSPARTAARSRSSSKVRARHLLARADAPAVDCDRDGEAARWNHGCRLVRAGHDRPRADRAVSHLRLLRRRARPGLRTLASRRHRPSHRGHGLRARPEHDDEPHAVVAGVARAHPRCRHGDSREVRPDPCNTGYLRGHYTYDNAIVVNSGFFGSLYLAKPVTFGALSPLGQTFTFAAGAMDVWYSRDRPRRARDETTTLPYDAVCAGRRNRRVRRRSPPSRSARPRPRRRRRPREQRDQLGRAHPARRGSHRMVRDLRTRYLYLPAGPYASFSPVATGTFAGPSINWFPMRAWPGSRLHVAGISFRA